MRARALDVDVNVFTDFSELAAGSGRPSAAFELAPALLRQADAAGIELAEALRRLSGKSVLFVRMVKAMGEEAATLPVPLTGPESAAVLQGLRGLTATLGACRLADLAADGERTLNKLASTCRRPANMKKPPSH